MGVVQDSPPRSSELEDVVGGPPRMPLAQEESKSSSSALGWESEGNTRALRTPTSSQEWDEKENSRFLSLRWFAKDFTHTIIIVSIRKYISYTVKYREHYKKCPWKAHYPDLSNCNTVVFSSSLIFVVKRNKIYCFVYLLSIHLCVLPSLSWMFLYFLYTGTLLHILNFINVLMPYLSVRSWHFFFCPALFLRSHILIHANLPHYFHWHKYFIVWIYCFVFDHSFLDGHLVCFYYYYY